MVGCKRVDVLIRAITLLSEAVRSKCHVIIVGEGEKEDAWKRIATRLGVLNCVEFRPLMPVSQVRTLMSESDIYVFPSDSEEGWGVALEEAMDRCCVPIANEEAGVTQAVVQEGINGFVFKGADAARIAERIEWLLKNPDERLAMGIKAWQSVQVWSPKMGAKRLAELIAATQNGVYAGIPIKGPCSEIYRESRNRRK